MGSHANNDRSGIVHRPFFPCFGTYPEALVPSLFFVSLSLLLLAPKWKRLYEHTSWNCWGYDLHVSIHECNNILPPQYIYHKYYDWQWERGTVHFSSLQQLRTQGKMVCLRSHNEHTTCICFYAMDIRVRLE